ncbi:hypothetical protein [Nannocystis bainbridge]|uniref:Uncharacterized protein n=1 Tax=Nannocystis bainbridge TaxID=2995303 RepID=A0ABT5DTQ9_9BACT|nr:hypothetical protein [Nannocystis bainbridge]MDC0717029.1 hypothetical protein [Nannocystis bainbridge]
MGDSNNGANASHVDKLIDADPQCHDLMHASVIGDELLRLGVPNDIW